MLKEQHQAWGYTTSTGLGFTHEEIVDAHFAACAPHYRRALEEVGVRPGWRVLDAGCGTGAFLPWLAELVGDRGRVSAIDLAAENVEVSRRRVAESETAALVDVRQGDLLELPYPDDSFDAVWCSNTTQYLDDGQLDAALAELRRVVRPGGLVAVKDLDASLTSVRPGDPFLLTDFFRRAALSPGYARQLLRARDLPGRLADAGLTDVRDRTILIEHRAPMSPAVRRFYGDACARLAGQAVELGMDGDWSPLLDPEAPGHPLLDPRGYVSEGNTVAVGVVPGGPAAG
ncbi:class I SAM-dependent methyltransferase [Streptomyces sp. NPDC046203]|uniref:class I SAM-dependent methyltransferase n=1 Tax=Streptomyces sp. NPDC046203 TaxID=3154602 RepID=UPI0033E832EE